MRIHCIEEKKGIKDMFNRNQQAWKLKSLSCKEGLF